MATKDEINAARAQAELVLLQQIAKATHSPHARNFAEAYAWLVSPNNGHGGTTEIKSS